MSAKDDLKNLKQAQAVLIRNIRNHGQTDRDLKRLKQYAAAIAAIKNKINQDKRSAENRK